MKSKIFFPSLFFLLVFYLVAFLVSYAPVSVGYTTETPFSSLALFLLSLAVVVLVLCRLNALHFKKNTGILFLFVLFVGFYIVFLTSKSMHQVRLSAPPVIFSVFTLAFSLVFVKAISRSEGNASHLYFHGVFIFSVISAFFALILYFTGGFEFLGFSFLQLSSHPRIHGWYGNPNRFSPVLVVGIIAGSYLLSSELRKCARFRLIILLFVLGAAIILSGSRAMIVTAAACVFFYYFLNLNSILPRLALLVSGFLLISLLSLVLITEASFLSDIFHRQSSTEDRFSYLTEGISAYSNFDFFNLWFGSGYRSFQDYMVASAHNGYVRGLFEFGLFYIISMALLFSLSFFFISRSIMPKSLRAAFLTSLFFILLREFSSPALWQTRLESFYFFSLLAVAFSYYDSAAVKVSCRRRRPESDKLALRQ